MTGGQVALVKGRISHQTDKHLGSSSTHKPGTVSHLKEEKNKSFL